MTQHPETRNVPISVERIRHHLLVHPVVLVLFAASVMFWVALVAMVTYLTRRSNALPDEVVHQIRATEPARPNQYLVDLELRDGRVMRNVYVAWGRYPSMSWRVLFRRFRPSDVVAARPANRSAP